MHLIAIFSHLFLFNFGYFKTNLMEKTEMKYWLNSLNPLGRSLCKAADDGLDSRKDVSLQMMLVGTREGCLSLRTNQSPFQAHMDIRTQSGMSGPP